MKIELQQTLEGHLRHGVNLFLGAGFSIYSKNNQGMKLPLGSALAKELAEKFECPKVNDLSKVCTIIDSVNSVGLRDFLVQRFSVGTYDKAYDALLKINSPRIFTTNIDNLAFKIFDNTTEKYLNNVFIHGSCFNDNRCVDFIPIHGSVEMPDIKFLFNKQEISGSHRSQLNAWMSLTHAANQIPSLFLGYSLDDVGAIESLFGSMATQEIQKDKWIMLHEENAGSIAYFKALGFKIIVGDILEFLNCVDRLELTSLKIQSNGEPVDYIEKIYPESCVPRSLKSLSIRQIDDFFLGSAPIWSDVLSQRIQATHHLDLIADLSAKNKHLIVTGIPASGKSTLMLQLANKVKDSRRVLLFNDLTVNKSNIIKNEIKKPTTILVDNCTSDVEAFINLATNKNITLVGFDRYYNIDIIFHRLPESEYQIHDVSDLDGQDIQKIYNSIPLPIRKREMTTRRVSDDQVSIFELVSYNVTKPSIGERYKTVLREMSDKDPILLDLLIMVCYVHACRIPASFEMANAFLSEDGYNFDDVLNIMNSLQGLVNESFGSILSELDADQDYYQPRSQILSETIVEQTRSADFRRMFEKFHDLVPQHLIPNFHVFKRSAYDAGYTSKAFPNWEDGLAFYEKAYLTDKNPFLLQQCALYLLKRRRYSEAALKIDKALQTSYKRFISIENSHAIILFKANIESETNEMETRKTLDKSMAILIKCYADDQRKTYHALTFAEQALDYFKKYTDSTAIEYLTISKKWLLEMQFHARARYLLRDIEKAL